MSKTFNMTDNTISISNGKLNREFVPYVTKACSIDAVNTIIDIVS